MIRNMKKIIGFLCSVIFCTIIAAGMPQMAKAAEIAINEINFPDEKFRNYVKKYCDKDNSNGLSESEIANIQNINAWQYNITSLKGIEYFTALKELDCSSNQLAALDVSKNTALTNLDCSSNQLAALDVSKNTALTNLDCNSNQLTTLDISKNTALEDLFCSSNQLAALDISKNMALERLVCYGNQLTALDLSKNTALALLDFRNNQLAALDISKNTALGYLDCSSNQLAALDVSKNTALEDLYCDSNQLTALDVSKNTALEGLSCDKNQLAALDVSKNTALGYLHCSSNQLTALDVSKNTALTNLDCSSNQLAALDVSKNTALKYLYCSSNQLAALDISKHTALEGLRCSYNQLTELKLHNQTYNKLLLYKGYLHGYGNVSYGNVSLSNLQNITEIATSDSYKISELKVTDITKPATYKVNGKDFTIIYTGTVTMPSESPSPSPSGTPSVSPAPSPSTSPDVQSGAHIFSDYNYTSPVTSVASDAPVIYGNGINKKTDGKRVNNKSLTLYTDILASYKHTPSNNGTVKSAAGKVIVAVTKTNVKPVVNSRNKVTDTSASKIARAKIKNGQITVTAVGKECGLVYLWVIDTGSKGVYASCPVDVKLAPKKLEVQGTSGTKLTNTKLQNGTTLDVHITGLAGQVKTEDCTYTAAVGSKYQQYVQIVPKGTTGKDFTITSKGLKNNKNTKAVITFTCNQNGKKVKFSLLRK